METKVKEEIPEKEYSQTNNDRRKATPKERQSPDRLEGRGSPAPPSLSPSIHSQGPTDSLSPPLSEGIRHPPAVQKLRRFLSTLQQFATDSNQETGERVRQYIFNLMSGLMSVEDFQSAVQECTNYPLRASVPGFLKTLLPIAQRDLHARAKLLKQTPLQYIKSHEHLILEPGGDTTEVFAPQGPLEVGAKRKLETFNDPSTNGDEQPHCKRLNSTIFNPPVLYPLNNVPFDYHYHGYHGNQEGFERRGEVGISVRDVPSMNAAYEPRQNLSRTDDEWKNINTMLNCILSMVEKTKRALAILQQRGMEPSEPCDMKRAANEIMTSTVRQTEERVAEVRRRAEEAVNQMKRQALLELSRAAERSKGRLEADKSPAGDASPTGQQNSCWNCGRKAQETCSGCNLARYCGAFCQHKDWESHHQVCNGRDHKPVLRSSSPVPKNRSSTPSTNGHERPEPRLSLNTTDRLLNTDRLLANIGGNLVGVAAKK